MLGSTLEHVNRFLFIIIYFSSFPSLVVSVVLFCQFIYFHIFSFSHWLLFFLLLAFSLCCARFCDSRISSIWLSLHSRNFGCDEIVPVRPYVRPFSLADVKCHTSVAWSPRHIKSVFNLILDIQIMVNSKLSKEPCKICTWIRLPCLGCPAKVI